MGITKIEYHVERACSIDDIVNCHCRIIIHKTDYNKNMTDVIFGLYYGHSIITVGMIREIILKNARYDFNILDIPEWLSHAPATGFDVTDDLICNAKLITFDCQVSVKESAYGKTLEEIEAHKASLTDMMYKAYINQCFGMPPSNVVAKVTCEDAVLYDAKNENKTKENKTMKQKNTIERRAKMAGKTVEEFKASIEARRQRKYAQDSHIDRALFQLRRLGIKKVIFNGPATVVLFRDGDSVVVKLNENDSYSYEAAIAMAILKHDIGEDNFRYVIDALSGCKGEKISVGLYDITIKEHNT